jgi:hypothetical protein
LSDTGSPQCTGRVMKRPTSNAHTRVPPKPQTKHRARCEPKHRECAHLKSKPRDRPKLGSSAQQMPRPPELTGGDVAVRGRKWMATFRWQNEDGSFEHLHWKALPKAKLLKLVKKELAAAAYHEDGLPVPSVRLHRVFQLRSSLCTTVAAGKAVRSQGQQATDQAATPYVPAKAPGKPRWPSPWRDRSHLARACQQRVLKARSASSGMLQR